MLTPEDFKRSWEADGDRLAAIPPDEIPDGQVPAATRSFLIRAGLPEEATPYLSFDAKSRRSATGLLRATTGRVDVLIVGANGSGDPVGVRADGALVCLNHDAQFAEAYINKDIETFAETSLRMRSLVAETQRTAGPDAYLDGLVPAALRRGFLSFLTDADPAATKPGALWADEIARWRA